MEYVIYMAGDWTNGPKVHGQARSGARVSARCYLSVKHNRCPCTASPNILAQETQEMTYCQKLGLLAMNRYNLCYHHIANLASWMMKIVRGPQSGDRATGSANPLLC